MYENIWKSMIVCTNNVFVKVQRDKTTGCGLLKVVKELDNQFCHPDQSGYEGMKNKVKIQGDIWYKQKFYVRVNSYSIYIYTHVHGEFIYLDENFKLAMIDNNFIYLCSVFICIS